MTTPFRNPGGAALTGAMPNREIDVTRANTIIKRCVINAPSCSRLLKTPYASGTGQMVVRIRGIPSEDPFGIQFAVEPQRNCKISLPATRLTRVDR